MPLVLALFIALTSGCASNSGTSKADEQNPFAEYPVADILKAGDQALNAGETERAVYIYMQALEIEQSAETWYRIGLGKGRLGDKGYAWRAFEKSIELDPDHVGAHEELGLTYMAMAQPQQAKPHLQKATELDPNRWRAWNALGVLADMDKQYAAAVDNYHAGLIAAPESPILMTNIGYSYYLAGDMDQAASWYGRALLAAEDYPPAVKNLALLYARRGWYDEAVQTFSKVVPKPQAYNDVGYVAMREGNYEVAFELLTEAIRLSPSYYQKAYENLELVKKQMANANKVRPAEAALNSSSNRIVVADGQEPRKAIVTAELLNVRSAPESDADIVTHLKAGEKVEVIMTKPGWAFVNYRPAANDDNLTGWVNSRYVGSSEQASTLAAEPATPKADATDASADKAESASESTESAAASTPVAQTEAASENTSEPETVITYAVSGESDITTTALTEIIANTVAEPTVVAVIAADTGSVAVTAADTEADITLAGTTIELPEPATTQSVAPSDTAITSNPIADTITRKVGAVCEPGSQAEKTPQGAGSCMGVASLSADQ